MTAPAYIHPVERLAPRDKCDIYFSRVVDLATLSGLIEPDPDTEIGHFAFSRHYVLGRDLDRDLQTTLQEFEQKYPEIVAARRTSQNRLLMDAADKFVRLANEEKIRDLKLIGASYRVWPTATSFALSYPWDCDGRGRTVKFREDLPDFVQRRILAILKKTGKLRNPDLFPK